MSYTVTNIYHMVHAVKNKSHVYYLKTVENGRLENGFTSQISVLFVHFLIKFKLIGETIENQIR